MKVINVFQTEKRLITFVLKKVIYVGLWTLEKSGSSGK